MRSLGQFVGHIWQGIRSDPTAPAGPTAVPAAAPNSAGVNQQAPHRSSTISEPVTELVRHETAEELRDTPAGRVIVRRTVIEEVELRPPEVPGN